MTLNIVASLIGSFIFFFLGLLWKDYIIKWLKNLRYDGIDISGKWVVDENLRTAEGYELSKSSDFNVQINQVANFISGEATSRIKNHDDEEYVKYKIDGKIKDRFVHLNFILDEKNRISKNIFLLEVLGNGNIMEGYMSFYAIKAKEINSLKTKWRKKSLS